MAFDPSAESALGVAWGAVGILEAGRKRLGAAGAVAASTGCHSRMDEMLPMVPLESEGTLEVKAEAASVEPSSSQLKPSS